MIVMRNQDLISKIKIGAILLHVLFDQWYECRVSFKAGYPVIAFLCTVNGIIPDAGTQFKQYVISTECFCKNLMLIYFINALVDILTNRFFHELVAYIQI